jgi:hypothetical protein
LIVPFFEECVRCIVGGPASLFVRFGAIVLFFPTLIGGILLAARLTKPGRNRDRAVIAVSVFNCVVLLFALLVLTGDWPARYSPLVLHEGAFEWPIGCAKREYYDGDQISIACHAYRNTLPRKLVFDHGFAGLTERTEHDYFRVGSEAINFRCNYFSEKCTVRYAEHRVFR